MLSHSLRDIRLEMQGTVGMTFTGQSRSSTIKFNWYSCFLWVSNSRFLLLRMTANNLGAVIRSTAIHVFILLYIINISVISKSFSIILIEYCEFFTLRIYLSALEWSHRNFTTTFDVTKVTLLLHSENHLPGWAVSVQSTSVTDKHTDLPTELP